MEEAVRETQIGSSNVSFSFLASGSDHDHSLVPKDMTIDEPSMFVPATPTQDISFPVNCVANTATRPTTNEVEEGQEAVLI